jgi:hypothetical protein
MHTHQKARLKPLSRKRLLRGHIDGGEPLKALAAQAAISLRTAYKWLARYRSGGHTSLADPRSVRRTQRRTHDPQKLQHALDLRHQRCTLRRIAKSLGLPSRPWAGGMKTLGLRRLRNLEPQGSCAEEPVGEAGRHDPCRHLAAGFSAGVTAGPFPAGRAPDRRRPPSRLLPGRWIRKSPRRGG